MKSADLLWLITQLGAPLTLIAMWMLSGARSPYQRCRGWMVQLIAQPFWLIATIAAGQWGMFAVTAVMILVCCRALIANFEDHMRQPYDSY